MERAAIATGAAVTAIIPGIQIYLTLISIILFLILAIQIWLICQRCKDRNKRLRILLGQVKRRDD